MSPARPKLADPGALIRTGKLRTDTYRVCVDPDLIAEHQALTARRDLAKDAARDSLAGGSVVELEEQLAELAERMEAATITLTLRALSRPKFRAMTDRHPMRKDAEGKLTHVRDASVGVAYEPFFDELLRASIESPQLAPEDLDTLLDELLTDGQYDDLTTVAWNLNREKVDIPFSPAVSRSRRTS